MDEKTRKRRKFIIGFLYFVILFGLSILFIRFALPQLWAFVIAFFVVQILHKPVDKLYGKMNQDNPLLHHNTICVIFVLLFYATVGVAAMLLAIWAVKGVSSLMKPIAGYITNTVAPTVSKAFSELESLSDFSILGFEINATWLEEIDYQGIIKNITSSLASWLTSLSATILSETPTIASSATSVFINFIICIVSTSFGLIDYDNIKTFIFEQKLIKPKVAVISNVCVKAGEVIKKYLGSYLLIMLITFAELAVGLLIILGKPTALALAAIIAIFDILPIIGSGLFLFPWAVISLFTGEIGQGIGLLILWFILSVIRNIIEPKIVGDQVGIHPLLTLLAMIVGQFVYGPIGLLLLPVILAVCQKVNAQKKDDGEMQTARDGYLPIYVNIPADKYKTYNEGKIETFISGIMDKIVDFIKVIFIKLWKACFRQKDSRTENEPAKPESKPKSAASKSKKSKKKSGK